MYMDVLPAPHSHTNTAANLYVHFSEISLYTADCQKWQAFFYILWLITGNLLQCELKVIGKLWFYC